MPIYSPAGSITYENFDFDNFLRKRSAPSLLDENFSIKEARMGGEIIYESGNIFPRTISRDNLAQEAFLMTLPTGIQPVQFATGYCSELNNYIFAVNWDGTNYKLYRLNTTNLMAPFQDGYSVNIPSGVDGVRGVAVTDTRVAVGLYFTDYYYNRNRLTVYDFSLNKIKDFNSPFPYDDNFGIDRRFTFDGNYLCIFKPALANNYVLDAKQEGITELWQGMPANNWQTFTTGPLTTKITKVGWYGYCPGQYTIQIRTGDGITTLWTNSPSDAQTAGWHEYTLDLTVNPNTLYRLYLIEIGNPIYLYYQSGNPYPGGDSGANSNYDWAFRIYTTISGRTSNRIERYKFDETKTYYELVDNIPCSLSTTPNDLMAFDGKFYYGYNSSSKKIIKFVINPDNTITLADEIGILEDVRGMLNFNNFIFICYTFGTGSVAVPVSI
jgi:hypothetical protein